MTFFVSPAGSDANPGTSEAPWRTLQKAADALAAGQTVLVHGGSYEGFSMTRSGAPGRPIRFVSYPLESRPIISGARLDLIDLSGVHDVAISGFVVQGPQGDGGRGAGIRVENVSTRVTVRDSLIRKIRGYGIDISDSTFVTVEANEIAYNEEGVVISGTADGDVIKENRVHHQNRMVVNTRATKDDDHGAVGIAMVHTTGPMWVIANRLWANRAPSFDYGWDGGAFEIYGASDVTIAGNRTWDNENVLETGTDDRPCSNNVFRGNVSYGATTRGRSFGIFLRCGDGMIVANNDFIDLDQFVFSVGGSSRYDGSIAGLTIVNNIAVMASGKIIGLESALPSSVVIDYNLMFNSSGGLIATILGGGATGSLATFAAWTGYQRHGIDEDPRFASAIRRDYRLTSRSPAIDHGAIGFESQVPYAGRADDLGRKMTVRWSLSDSLLRAQ